MALISRPISAKVSSVSRILAFRLEQPRIDDRLRNVCAKLPQHRLVARRERVLLIGQQVQRADHFALVPQRHGQDRLDVLDDAHVTAIRAARR